MGQMTELVFNKAKKSKSLFEGKELTDFVFLWSLEDIHNEELYKDQVEKIPLSFESLKNYFSSFVFPLLEETRADLSSSMDVISVAPFSQVVSIESKPRGPLAYDIRVDLWKNRFRDGSKEPYKTLPGDIFIITEGKPENHSDLQRLGWSWAFAMVTNIMEEDRDSGCISYYDSEASTSCTNFRVKASNEIHIEDMRRTSLFVIFLMNITTNRRIWNALHMFRNLKIIKDVMCYNFVVDGDCNLSLENSQGVSLEDSHSHLLSNLNESQVKAILASLTKVQCSHKSSVHLIWGPPGTGKTRTISTLLFILLGFSFRTLVCAPTNVAITELASRVLMLVNNYSEVDSIKDDVIRPLGDILLFGNNDRLKVRSEFECIYLDYRVKKLVECLGPVTGWRYCFTSLIDFLKSCVSHYRIFLENEAIKEREHCDRTVENTEDKSFLKFTKERFKALASPLRKCVLILCTHVPKTYIQGFNYRNMVSLVQQLDEFETLLCQKNVDSEELEQLFSSADLAVKSCESQVASSLQSLRSKCLSVLLTLQLSLGELNLPMGMNRSSIEEFCLRTSSLIFCTSSSSYKLHSVTMEPLDLLVIDEAAQLKECESMVPLQLPGLSHLILVGDECQLPATVKSKVSDEAGFGRSLFERLSSLGYSKNLLNIQYRMHPSISFFPNSKFYFNQILDAANVKDKSSTKHYLPGPMFGPYSFINVFGGKEEMDDVGYSIRNMAEVAVVAKLVRNLHKAWSGSKEKLTVGVVSPYAAQVVAIQDKFGKRYEKLDNLLVKVKSIDGFQGGEEDIIIISLVRSNRSGSIGFIIDPRRTNVALTRARRCLWVLGNGKTLSSSESVWQELICDAKNRKCYFNADEDKDMAKAILEVKKEYDQLDDLLNGQSVLFRSARWKVLFSDDFKKSFAKLVSIRTKTSVVNLLLRLSSGWRPKKRSVDIVFENSSCMLKQFKVEGLYVMCSVDIKKESSYTQVLKVWDILPLEDIPKLVKRLDSIFSRYTDDFISRCKERHCEGDLEVPKTWMTSFDVVRFKDQSNNELETNLDDGFNGRNYIENSKVNESLLLMKFYALSPSVVSHLLSDRDIRELDLPFDVTDREREIILFHRSTFILGRSGTGKTTVLTMKLFRNEQLHHLATEGITEDVIDDSLKSVKDVAEAKRDVLRQLFVTVSPKLCYAVKQHVSHLKRFTHGRKFSGGSSSTEGYYFDDTAQYSEIPDSFVGIPLECYPLVVTFRKFLMMLDGTVGSSYFERFLDVREIICGKDRSNSISFQTFITTREVNYDRFCSSYWPHFNTQLSKNLDPSRVFTEIISYIKGGLQGESKTGKLSREDYVLLSEGRNSTLTRMRRENIYDLFWQYEKMKTGKGEFDLADLVIDLHSRLRHEMYKGDEMDFVYIDEVQDLTMRQIALFKYVSRNVDEGFVFSGDTAQTIARGIDFRFEDIRSLFYKEFILELRSSQSGQGQQRGLISPIFHLNQNFRTHDGILKLSQSIIDLLYRFFPSSIDILDPETSLIYGEAPVLLESGNEENAIITIFGNTGKAGSNMVGFGAEQVILVRDDCARKEIVSYVGKQALILTIVECKGLEFQDVLLYNFFGTSPLKNQWRVIYEYMKEQDLLESKSQLSFPTFSETRHNVLCSELKQLYVAITRTRQRLWICENTEDLSRPMFDYWKKLCLVQVRKLDESLAQAMQVASTKEEWRLRGSKLLAEENYEMATMCFERAGDSYSERMAKAQGLEAAAKRMHGSNPEMACVVRREAAEIFEAIGDATRAADCYARLEEFEKAGRIYLERCSGSEMKKAGECFFLAKCYELAADVYARGNFFSECLAACTKGKFFDMGLQYIQYWKHALSDNAMTKRSEGMEEIEQKFLESCALHHYELKDKRAMMKFVKEFQSVDLMRTFLRTLDCLEELLLLEEESGNFLEAAEIAREKGDFLLEANLLGKAHHFKEACKLILWYVLPGSLWVPGSKGWPLKQFTQKQQLLAMAETFSEGESELYRKSVLREAKLLSNEGEGCCLFDLKDSLKPFEGYERLGGEILSARKILDIHFSSNVSNYDISDKMVSDLQKYSENKFSVNRVSLETLVYTWSFWKKHIVNILKYLESLETQDVSEYVEYEEFCLNYLGVHKQYNNVNTIFVLLYSDAYWVKEIDGRYLRKNDKAVTLDVCHFVQAAQGYWSSEMFSVGMKVVGSLEALHKFSVKNSFSVFAQSMILVNLFDITNFIMESKLSYRENKRLQSCLEFSTQHFFSNAFPSNLEKSLDKNMISLRQTEFSWSLLRKIISSEINMKNKITYGQIGRVVMIVLGSGKLNDDLWEALAKRFEANTPWRAFIEKLGKITGSVLPQVPMLNNSSDASTDISVVWRFYEALKDTFSANWMREYDYISPFCFLYLLERLQILVTSSHGFFFAAKSSFVEWLMCLELHTVSNASFKTDFPPSLKVILDFVATVVEQLLYDKFSMVEWIRKSNVNINTYYPLLVLRLVVIVCILCLVDSQKYSRILSILLGRTDIVLRLPHQFLEVISRGKKRNWVNLNVKLLAEALKKIDNPLVIVSLGMNCSKFVCPDAVFVDMSLNQCKEDILRVVFPKDTKASNNGSTEVGSTSSRSSINSYQGNNSAFACPEFSTVQDKGDEICKAQMVNVQFWEMFGASNSLKSGSENSIECLKSDAPRIKVEAEKYVNIITSLLARSIQGPSDSEDGKLVNDMLIDLKQLASALHVSEPELKKSFPKVQELYRRILSRRPIMERFLNRLILQKGLTSVDEPTVSNCGLAANCSDNSVKDMIKGSDSSACCGSHNKNDSQKQESNKSKSKNKPKVKKSKGRKK